MLSNLITVRWSLFLVVFLTFLLETFAIKYKTSNDTLRALWNLEKMSECRLGYSALTYNDYGCWCGVGGSGTPMDGIDTCCMYHDKCYDKAIDDGVCFDVPWEYVDDYSWSCINKEPNCTEPQDPCKAYLCWCDKTVVDCWANYEPPTAKAKCVPHAEDPSRKDPKLKTVFDEICEWLAGVAHHIFRLPVKTIDLFRGRL